MFNRAKEEKNKRRAANIPRLGIFEIPEGTNELVSEDDIDDEDLEAELLALTSGGGPKSKKIVRAKNNLENLDVMVAASLKDTASDDDELVDENDPELLAELGDLVEEVDHSEENVVIEKAPPSSQVTESNLQLILKDRLQMYEKAEHNANAAGEASRARRFARGIRILKEQLKLVKSGGSVNEADIPPPVALGGENKEQREGESIPSGLSKSKNLEPASSPTPSTVPINNNMEIFPKQEVDNEILNTLFERRNAYRQEALNAKKNGDNEGAIKFVRTVKQFDCVIAAVKSGHPVDLSEMPPMPETKPRAPSRKAPPPPLPKTPSKQESTHVTSSETGNGCQSSPKLLKATPLPPSTPTTVMEALEQRLNRYKEVEQSAKEEGNSSKARRLGRIVKQYQSAIDAYSKGKSIPFDELPTPPGFAPFPGQPTHASSEVPPVDSVGNEAEEDPESNKSAANRGHKINQVVSPSIPSLKDGSADGVSGSVSQHLTRHERQMDELLKRQAMFKKAALEAKKGGDLVLAREHLRIAKGIDPLIEASRAGLPVDMSTLPLPPEEKASLVETDFDFVTAEDCIPGSVTEVYEKLEENLLKQVTMCINTRDHFRAIGDVGSGNRFERLALDSKKDLDAVRAASAAHKLELSNPSETAPPRFHYENKTFSIVKCNTNLSDNDIEFTVIRGINYNLPNGAETYVRFEFPYPAECPQKDRTHTSKDNNPVYEHSFLLSMHRSSRPCQRIFRRQSLKLEVWSKGSWLGYFCCYCCGKCGSHDYFRSYFRGDSLIGTANVKLQPLETKCTLHDSFPLMEGRKPIGGKLEVKMCIRNPILGRQVEKVTEKWLIIDKL